MRRLTALILGIVIGGGLVFAAFHVHVVRSDKGTLFVTKKQVSFGEFYVDVREWDLDRWRQSPALADALISAGHSDVVAESTAQGAVSEMLRNLGALPARQ